MEGGGGGGTRMLRRRNLKLAVNIIGCVHSPHQTSACELLKKSEGESLVMKTVYIYISKVVKKKQKKMFCSNVVL